MAALLGYAKELDQLFSVLQNLTIVVALRFDGYTVYGRNDVILFCILPDEANKVIAFSFG